MTAANKVTLFTDPSLIFAMLFAMLS
jgi:hypothetical protein